MCSRWTWNPFRRRSRATIMIPFLMATSWRTNAFSVLHFSDLQSTKTSSSFLDHQPRMIKERNSNSISSPRRKSVSCRLFFRKTDINPAPRRRSLKPGILEELISAKISFPFQVLLEDDNEDTSEVELTIRFMTTQDLSDVLPLCIDEFGSGPTETIKDFPWQDLRCIPRWWDRVYFEPSIALALRAKMNANLGQPQASKGDKIEDPAVLVLCRRQQYGGECQEAVVGMVELSLQPPEVNKNPPSYPIPTWIKYSYCQLTGQKLQGWVTNLLIDSKYRGLGYSKILMAATEGVARSWNRDAIYLHADADYRSGKIPQALYKGLGYEVVTDTDPQFAWMSGGNSNPFSSIQMIEGVPLLCFCKRL